MTADAARVLQALRRHHRLLAVSAFVGLLWLGYRQAGLAGHFELSALRQGISGHETSELLIFIALFALGNLLQVPGAVFLAAAVFALGAAWGGVVTYLAAVVSCSATFLLIRLIGDDALRQLDHRWARPLFRQLDAAPVRSVAALRLLFQTLPALNYALALSGLRWRHYLIGSLLGLPLPIALYCLFFERIAVALGAA